jgi:hypothetical protein
MTGTAPKGSLVIETTITREGKARCRAVGPTRGPARHPRELVQRMHPVRTSQGGRCPNYGEPGPASAVQVNETNGSEVH